MWQFFFDFIQQFEHISKTAMEEKKLLNKAIIFVLFSDVTWIILTMLAKCLHLHSHTIFDLKGY